MRHRTGVSYRFVPRGPDLDLSDRFPPGSMVTIVKPPARSEASTGVQGVFAWISNGTDLHLVNRGSLHPRLQHSLARVIHVGRVGKTVIYDVRKMSRGITKILGIIFRHQITPQDDPPWTFKIEADAIGSRACQTGERKLFGECFDEFKAQVVKT